MLTKFPFDPLGLDSEANREKEVKNGRLAMVSLCAGNTGAGVCCSCLEHIKCRIPAAACQVRASRKHSGCSTWFLNLLKLVQVAFVGFVVQALVVRSNGPIEDLNAHLSNPFGEAALCSFAFALRFNHELRLDSFECTAGNNILTNIGNLPLNVSK